MFGGLRLPVFLTFFYYWPIFLIGAGIALILRKYPFIQTLIFLAEVLLFILLGIYIGSGGDVDLSTAPERILKPDPEIVIQEDTVLRLRYEILFASGDVDSGNVDFFRIETEDKYLSADYDVANKSLSIGSDEIGVIALPGNRNSDVSLSSELQWDIHLDGVFSRVGVDLDELQLTSLYSESAFCSNVIRLPEPEGTVPVVLDSGLASTVIYLPAGTPVSISVDKGLAQVAFGPTSLKSATHHLNGYSQEEDRYEITVDVGLGSVQFEEY